MPSPFPGMDPYLEYPGFWADVHHRLITAIAVAIAPALRPNYRAVVEESVYQTAGQNALLIGMPDVSVVRSPRESRSESEIAVAPPPTQPITVTVPVPETIRQGYLTVREMTTNRVVTVLEVLSPANKRPGKGRTTYEKKRQNILASDTHLLEIDLLRQWQPMAMDGHGLQTDYHILISRSQERPRAALYAFNLTDVIPAVPVPLREGDREPIINLKTLLDTLYDQSAYDLVIDYHRDPIPALSEAETIWVDHRLREQGYR